MRDLKHAVKKLRGEADAELTKRRAMNVGSKVTVDYFALIDLINYFDETCDAANRVAKARELLDGVFFSITPKE